MVEVAEKKIKVVVGDDHEIFLLGLSSLLKNSNNFDVVGKAIESEHIISLVRLHNPEILIIDFLIPGTNGIDLALKAKAHSIMLKTIVISNIMDESIVQQCKRSGIDGFVFKSEPKERLLEAINVILKNQTFYPSQSRSRLEIEKIKGSKQNPFHKLSPKELEFITYFTNGLTYSEIADKMEISDRTVNTHRVNVTRKLGKLTLGELINMARAWGIN